MQFIEIPKELFDQIPIELIESVSISPRINIDSTKLLLHIEIYDKLFQLTNTLKEDGNYLYPIYNSSSVEFNNLLKEHYIIDEA